jgi:DNA-binding response OmpR family regulator
LRAAGTARAQTFLSQNALCHPFCKRCGMKILIIEDESKISGFLCKGLRQEGHAVDTTPQGQEGLSMLQDSLYDLVLLDLMLPDMSGFDVLRKIKARENSPSVIILSAMGSVDNRVQGLDLGADDYMTKPISFAELCGRIAAVTRRKAPVAPHPTAPAEATACALDYDRALRQVRKGSATATLTAQEGLLLEFFLQNLSRPVPKRLIFEHVWNYDVDPQANVVDVLVCRLRAKLLAICGRDVIRTVRGLGYMLCAE